VSGAPEVPRPTALTRARRLVTTAVVGYLVLAGCGVLWAGIDEGGVPSGAPDLPVGFSVAGEQLQCASGGCWRELALRLPEGVDGSQALDLLRPALGCGPPDPITFRRTCTSLLDEDSPRRLVVAHG
jgi:hypothetical protein